MQINFIPSSGCSEPDTESQNKAILKYLKAGGRLTQLTALRLFDCLRLSARIYDLRALGHNIPATSKEVGRKKRVAEYHYSRKKVKP
jgi:hypothetical protein